MFLSAKCAKYSADVRNRNNNCVPIMGFLLVDGHPAHVSWMYGLPPHGFPLHHIPAGKPLLPPPLQDGMFRSTSAGHWMSCPVLCIFLD